MRKLLTIIILLMSVSICQGQEQKEPVSPCWYGLDEAKTDVERFYALYNTHVAALELGVDVNYDGVDKLDIEIPADAKPIPLTSYNLFKNLVLNVKNNSKHFFLFEMVQPADSIVVDKELIDKGHFESVKELRTGNYLLILRDDSPEPAHNALQHAGIAALRTLLPCHRLCESGLGHHHQPRQEFQIQNLLF